MPADLPPSTPPSTPHATDPNGQLGQFAEFLGLDVSEMTGERCAATWEALPRLHQPFGLVHGGVHCSVVETLASMGAASWLGDQGQVVGVNNNTDFYRASREGRMTSVGTPLHQGRSQQVWVVETHDDEGRLVSRGQVRLQNLTSPSAPSAPSA